MARKRKKSSKKSKNQDKEESAGLPEGFWRQVIVVLMILLAILLMFGSFGTGGAVAEGLFDWMRSLVGYVAFFAPFFLVFAAFQKQRGDSHKIPRSTFVGLVIFIAALAGFVHLFGDTDNSVAIADAGNGGGTVGHIVTSLLLTLFNKVTGAIVLIVAAVISLHFILKIPLTIWLRLIKIAPKKSASGAAEGEEESKDE